MTFISRIILKTIILIFLTAFSLLADEVPKAFHFDEDNALKEWQEKIFKDRVMYSVETVKEDGFLMAKSDQACSGLIYKIKFDVSKNPLMSWSWKVIDFPDQTKTNDEEGWVERDDYAARVYVIFYSWNFTKIKSLEYVWDSEKPEGTFMSSPYHENIKLIVAESGEKNLDQWVFEERNVYEDFLKAFGKKPPKHANAIALMTDSDNTISTAEAFYKDIKVGYNHE